MAASVSGMQLTAPTPPATPAPSLGRQKSVWKKGIPTLLGLGVLVVGLVVGVVVFGSGTGVFAPRASAETAPKNVKITNVTDRSFTVSFETDVASSAFLKYGTSANSTKTQIGDDRDQITGTVKPYPLHHITVSGLEAQTEYFFVLGTNSSATYDDGGKPFSLTTAKRANSPPAAKTIYGSVLTAAGGPAAGALVFVKLEGAGELSALVRDSGSWAVPLSNARTVDGATYANITPDSALVLIFKGTSGEKQQLSTTVTEYENGQSVTFGKPIVGQNATPSGQMAGATDSENPSADQTDIPKATPSGTLTPSPVATPSGTLPTASPSATATPSATPTVSKSSGNLLGSLLSGTDTATSSTEATDSASTVVDLSDTAPQTVTTDQPVIQGTAAPKVKVTVKVHSDTQIEGDVYADSNGEFEFDISAYAQTLEPGEHTIEYTYIDPNTGQEITKSKTFTVAPRVSQQLALAASPTPRLSLTPSPTAGAYGTGNPYVPTASPSASPSAAAATDTARAALPSTAGGIPQSGSVGTTWTLILGGLFFLFAGGWSWWIARELGTNRDTSHHSR